MMHRHLLYYSGLIALLSVCLQSCGPSRYLEEGQNLYAGSAISFSDKKLLDKEKELEEKIQANLYPKPNKKFIGLFRTNLWLYKNVNPKPGKTKGIKYWLKYKVGTKPVLTSEVDVETMKKVVKKTMQDNGYFGAGVTATLDVKNRKGTYQYAINHSAPRIIDTFALPGDRSELDSLLRNYKKFRVKKGGVYRLEHFTRDRAELAEYIRNHGYFDFEEQDILFIIDTAKTENTIGVYLKIKPPKDDTAHHKYYIRKVDIYPTKDVEENDSTSVPDTIQYKGMTIHQDFEFVRKGPLYRNTLIEPGKLFSVKYYNRTVNRYINMDVFKYVNINYRKSAYDSLDVDILLTPAQYKDFEFGLEANTSNRSFFGSLVSGSFINKNLFGRAEKLTVKLGIGAEFQSINKRITLNILNTNLEVRQEIPSLTGLFRSGKTYTEVAPKTYLKFQANAQQWLQYYALYSINIAYGYQWQTRGRFNHILEPISINRINILSTTPLFDSILTENPLLKLSFEDINILGGSYNLSFNTKRRNDQKSYFFFNGFLDFSGNLAYALFKLSNPDGERPYKILNAPFAQFTKVELELKHYWDISAKTKLVTRFNAGVGVASGNSEVMPYTKLFFVGGPNTIRAFQFRSIGPGRYTSLTSSQKVNPIEQSGDIKLLFNAEYRFTLYKFLKAGIFFDAGNVWLAKNDPGKPESQFKLGKFYQQLAIGSGAGLRLDFDFFVLRLDLGIPLYKPYAPEGQRWISQFPEKGFRDWRRNNFIWNLAIGYPF